MHSLPLYIDDTPAVSVSAVRTRARRLARTHGLGMIVIDYLQLLRVPSGGGRFENRVQEISDITRGLKALAKELNVPVLALSPAFARGRVTATTSDRNSPTCANRARSSRTPTWSCSIFREQYYLERAEPGRKADEADDKFEQRYADWQERCAEVHNTAEVIVAKQRHGPVGTVELYFEGQFTKFADLDEQHDAYPGLTPCPTPRPAPARC